MTQVGHYFYPIWNGPPRIFVPGLGDNSDLAAAIRISGDSVQMHERRAGVSGVARSDVSGGAAAKVSAHEWVRVPGRGEVLNSSSATATAPI